MVEHRLTQLVERSVAAGMRAMFSMRMKFCSARRVLFHIQLEVALGQLAVSFAVHGLAGRHEADGVGDQLVPLRHGFTAPRFSAASSGSRRGCSEAPEELARLGSVR